MKSGNLESSLLLNERMTETFTTSVRRTKNRLHMIELSYYLEPSLENKDEHTKWSSKLQSLMDHKDVCNFPSRHEIRYEIKQKQDQEMRQEILNRISTPNEMYKKALEKLKQIKQTQHIGATNQFGSKPDGEVLRVIPKYGYSNVGTETRTLIRKSRHISLMPLSGAPTWLGPGSYSNTDPAASSNRHNSTTYQHVFKAISRDEADPRRTRQIQEKMKRRCFDLKMRSKESKYIEPARNMDHLNEMYRIDEDNESDSQFPLQSTVPRTTSRLHIRPDSRQNISRQISEHSSRFGSSEHSASLMSPPGFVETPEHLPYLQLNHHINHMNPAHSRRGSVTSSSRRTSIVSETAEFANKLIIESSIPKYTAVKKDYTLGGLAQQSHSGILMSDYSDEADLDEVDLLSLSMSLSNDSAKGLSKGKSFSLNAPGTLAKNMSTASNISRSIVDRPMSYQNLDGGPSLDSFPVSFFESDIEDPEIVTATYPHFTEDLEPYIQKWYEANDIYVPEKISKSKREIPHFGQSSPINLTGLLLPGDTAIEFKDGPEDNNTDPGESDDDSTPVIQSHVVSF